MVTVTVTNGDGNYTAYARTHLRSPRPSVYSFSHGFGIDTGGSTEGEGEGE